MDEVDSEYVKMSKEDVTQNMEEDAVDDNKKEDDEWLNYNNNDANLVHHRLHHHFCLGWHFDTRLARNCRVSITRRDCLRSGVVRFVLRRRRFDQWISRWPPRKGSRSTDSFSLWHPRLTHPAFTTPHPSVRGDAAL